MLQARWYTPMKLKGTKRLKPYADDISITLLEFRMLCGPGAIANAIVLMQDSHTYAMKGILIGNNRFDLSVDVLHFSVLPPGLVKVLGETEIM